MKIAPYCIIMVVMKRTILIILVFLTGMTISAQVVDMSYFASEYNRPDATFIERNEILEVVRGANLTDI